MVHLRPRRGEPVGMGTYVVRQALPLFNIAKGVSLIHREGTSWIKLSPPTDMNPGGAWGRTRVGT